MATIKCPECNGEVSRLAASCPKCGYSLAGYIPPGTVAGRVSGHAFLKVYFWFYAAFCLAGTFRIFLMVIAKPSSFYLLLSCVVTYFAVAGVYLYAYEKDWLPVIFWKIIFFVYCATLIFNSIKSMPDFAGTVEKASQGSGGFIILYISFAIMAVIFFPVIYALFKYAFKRES